MSNKMLTRPAWSPWAGAWSWGCAGSWWFAARACPRPSSRPCPEGMPRKTCSSTNSRRVEGVQSLFKAPPDPSHFPAHGLWITNPTHHLGITAESQDPYFAWNAFSKPQLLGWLLNWGSLCDLLFKYETMSLLFTTVTYWSLMLQAHTSKWQQQ